MEENIVNDNNILIVDNYSIVIVENFVDMDNKGNVEDTDVGNFSLVVIEAGDSIYVIKVGKSYENDRIGIRVHFENLYEI